MKTVCKMIGSGLCAVSWLWVLPAAWSAVVPYSDTFSVPPYTNNTTIVGQQGWQNQGSGTPALAVITNDFTTTTSPIHPVANGFGTSLFIGNSSGAWGDVKQYFTGGLTNGNWQARFDLYGSLPSSTIAAPGVAFYDDGGGPVYEVAYVEALQTAGAGTNAFRLNSNNSLLVPGIYAQGSTWYTVSLVFHVTNRTYDVQITDGVSTGILNGVSFWTTGATNVDFVRMFPVEASSFPNGSGLIDNFSITVYAPEPGTVLLMATGVLIVAGRRRFVRA